MCWCYFLQTSFVSTTAVEFSIDLQLISSYFGTYLLIHGIFVTMSCYPNMWVLDLSWIFWNLFDKLWICYHLGSCIYLERIMLFGFLLHLLNYLLIFESVYYDNYMNTYKLSNKRAIYKFKTTHDNFLPKMCMLFLYSHFPPFKSCVCAKYFMFMYKVGSAI